MPANVDGEFCPRRAGNPETRLRENEEAVIADSGERESEETGTEIAPAAELLCSVTCNPGTNAEGFWHLANVFSSCSGSSVFRQRDQIFAFSYTYRISGFLRAKKTEIIIS